MPDFERSLTEHLQLLAQQHFARIAGTTAAIADSWYTTAKESLADLEIASLKLGIIRSSLPHINSYVVDMQHGDPTVATMLGHGSQGIGAHDSGSLEAGSTVLLMQEYRHRPATIIGVLNNDVSIKAAGDVAKLSSDCLVTSSGVGFYASPHYKLYVEATTDSGGSKLTTGVGPVDSLPGDYTVITANGVAVHIDEQLAMLRVSEVCGVFAFYDQELLRISGTSLEIESTAYQARYGTAVYECYGIEEGFIYPWEATGNVDPFLPLPIVEHGSSSVYGGLYGYVEPEKEQRSLARLSCFTGYLGQGQHTIISAPQIPVTENSGDEIAQAGLARQQIMMDGTILFETTSQLFMAKVADVPFIRANPDPAYLSEDESYRYSGSANVGEDALPHLVSRLPADERSSAGMAAEEYYCYASAWQGLHPAVYHPHNDIEYRDPTSIPASIDLSQSDRATLPQAERVRIDHRYNDVDIYRILSFISLLPDGDIVLSNGLGAEVRLSGGSVYINGLSINLNAAKTLSAFSRQIALRGNRDVEIVSSLGAVRIKAERDLNLLGGSSGRGGVLIESRSRSIQSNWEAEPAESLGAGVVIKSENSHVLLTGGVVIAKTNAAAGVNGPIVLDSGDNSIIQRGRVHFRYSAQAYIDYFGYNQSTATSANFYQSTYTGFAGSVGIGGNVLIDKHIQLRGWVMSAEGHFASARAADYQYMVPMVPNTGTITSNLQAVQDAFDQYVDIGNQVLESYATNYEEEHRPANPVTIRHSSFGFPSSRRYNAERVQLQQPLWQRKSIGSMTSWVEPTVTYRSSEETRPWPGQKTWTNSDSYLIVDTSDPEATYFDKQTAMPKNPNEYRELYEAASLSPMKPQSLFSAFKTT